VKHYRIDAKASIFMYSIITSYEDLASSKVNLLFLIPIMFYSIHLIIPISKAKAEADANAAETAAAEVRIDNFVQGSLEPVLLQFK
jgi:hypothetical protein